MLATCKRELGGGRFLGLSAKWTKGDVIAAECGFRQQSVGFGSREGLPEVREKLTNWSSCRNLLSLDPSCYNWQPRTIFPHIKVLLLVSLWQNRAVC